MEEIKKRIAILIDRKGFSKRIKVDEFRPRIDIFERPRLEVFHAKSDETVSVPQNKIVEFYPKSRRETKKYIFQEYGEA